MKADSKCFLQEVARWVTSTTSRIWYLKIRLWASVAGSFICIFFKRLETPDNRALWRGSGCVEPMLSDSFHDGERTDRGQEPLCMRSLHLLHMATCLLPTPRYLTPPDPLSCPSLLHSPKLVKGPVELIPRRRRAEGSNLSTATSCKNCRKVKFKRRSNSLTQSYTKHGTLKVAFGIIWRNLLWIRR